MDLIGNETVFHVLSEPAKADLRAGLNAHKIHTRAYHSCSFIANHCHIVLLVRGEEKQKLSRNVGCDLAPYLHFLTAHRLREVSVPRLMLLMSSRRSHTHTETYSAIQTVKYGLRTRKATAVNFLRKEDILHNRISPSLVRNMAGAYKRQREVTEDRTEEAAAKRHRLDVLYELPLITRHL